MKMKVFFSVIMAVAMLTACGGGSGKSGSKVSGTITNAEGKNLVLEKIENNMPVAIDTVKLDKGGKFEFSLPKGKRDFYRVVLGEHIVIICVDSTEAPVITGDAEKLGKEYKITGSKHSEIIASFYQEINKLTDERMALEQQMIGMNLADTAKVMALQSQMEQVIQKMNEVTKSYIDKHPTSPSLVVMQNFLNPETDMDYLKKIERALAASVPNSLYHNQVSTFISQYEYQKQQMEMQKQVAESLKIGSPMADIRLPNPQGQEMSLASLKGKVVLVDFWASWCGPCRKENPNVVALYDKFHSKGFEIFSVSLDQDKDRWVQAIQADGLKWPHHVSDLKQWQSVVVSQFGITGIPFTILVDRKGNVAAKGLRGPALDSKVEELIKAR